MKKIIVLFTILCAGQLYAMKRPSKESTLLETENIGGLPKELQDKITQTAIASSDNLDEAITTIKKLSTALGVSYDKLFSNLDDFTRVALTLADRFSIYPFAPITPYAVAQKLNTPIAERYMAGYSLLRDAVRWSNDEMGLDMSLKPLLSNYPGIAKIDPQILFLALEARKNTLEVIKLLLENGANPYGRDDLGKTFVEKVNEKIEFQQRYPTGSQQWTKIKALVEEALPSH